MLNAEFTDETGTVRTLTRDEILGYIALLVGGRERDDHPAHRLGRQALGEHPDQRKDLGGRTRG